MSFKFSIAAIAVAGTHEPTARVCRRIGSMKYRTPGSRGRGRRRPPTGAVPGESPGPGGGARAARRVVHFSSAALWSRPSYNTILYYGSISTLLHAARTHVTTSQLITAEPARLAHSAVHHLGLQEPCLRCPMIHPAQLRELQVSRLGEALDAPALTSSELPGLSWVGRGAA